MYYFKRVARIKQAFVYSVEENNIYKYIKRVSEVAK